MKDRTTAIAFAIVTGGLVGFAFATRSGDNPLRWLAVPIGSFVAYLVTDVREAVRAVRPAARRALAECGGTFLRMWGGRERLLYMVSMAGLVVLNAVACSAVDRWTPDTLFWGAVQLPVFLSGAVRLFAIGISFDEPHPMRTAGVLALYFNPVSVVFVFWAVMVFVLYLIVRKLFGFVRAVSKFLVSFTRYYLRLIHSYDRLLAMQYAGAAIIGLLLFGHAALFIGGSAILGALHYRLVAVPWRLAHQRVAL